MSERDEYYARIEKVTGTHLHDKTIGVYNAPFVSKAVELMASCGVLSFTFGDVNVSSEFMNRIWAICGGDAFEQCLVRELKRHNGFEDRWRFNIEGLIGTEQIIVAGGTQEACMRAFTQSREKNIPAVLGLLFANGTSAVAAVLPGQNYPFEGCDGNVAEVDGHRYFDWIDVNNQMANLTKAILLEGTPWQRSDVMSLLKSGKGTMICAHPQWPWVSRYVDVSDTETLDWLNHVMTEEDKSMNIARSIAGKTILIVGLGSGGSIIAEHLRILGCNIIGIDGKDVSVHNPVRQAYTTSDIGKSKAGALVQLLARFGEFREEADGDIVRLCNSESTYIGIKAEIPDSRAGAALFEEMLEAYSPDLVILATAHQAEFKMANLCRQKNIPHIIGRCYRRARWAEITIVQGNQGPCFGCMQGHLYTGISATMTEEQQARYDTAGDGANVVQAEPATRIETGRCADMLVRFVFQMLQQKADRAEWFSRMLEEERTCLIGGNYCEYHAEKNEWSYGVLTPGGVALYGVINFIGSETENEKICLYCGKTHEVLIKQKKPIQ